MISITAQRALNLLVNSLLKETFGQALRSETLRLSERPRRQAYELGL